jgi:hypothetical protein
VENGIRSTVKQVCRGCSLCSYSLLGPKLPPLIEPIQRRGSYPGENWQVNFTHMPPCQGYKQFLVFIDTFTGWTDSFPTQTERASEVTKALLKEIIPMFGLTQTL